MIERPTPLRYPESGLLCALLLAACAVVALATLAGS